MSVIENPFNYFRKHPIALLLLLSPGIPEYISGSSPLNAIVLNPGQFVFQLVANLGLYGPGVILIREAAVRWKKGWATILLLGGAYGILEEGIALSTLFNPYAGPVGQLGFYGHYLGVSWVWLFGLLPFHAIFSISLPILLFGLALPETKTESLIASNRGIELVFGILAADVSFLFLFVLRAENYWMGWPIFVSSFVAIALLTLTAKGIPRDFLYARKDDPIASPIRIAIVGALFFPSTLLVEDFVGIGIGVPELADVFLLLMTETLFLFYFFRFIGREKNEKQLIAAATGLITPIVIVGLIAQIRLPIVLVADLGLGFLFWKLVQKYSVTRKASIMNSNES